MYKFNSELEAVEENSVSPDMDVWLAFEGKGRPIGSVSIFTLYCKKGRGRIQIRFKAGSISVAIFSLLLFG
ncbi:hypothetical protein CXF88_05115 [Shewanella sp. ALD9]|nr:hypothetical protein CXF88_05115 [Shewanella sp. ALD9]